MYFLPAVLLLCLAQTEIPRINPVPPQVIATTVLNRWTFEKDTTGWIALHHCQLSAEGGVLHIRCTGDDPYFHRAVSSPGGQLILKMKARARGEGPGQIYWATETSPRTGEDKTCQFPLNHDGNWHEYAVRFSPVGKLTILRLDPGQGPGEMDIEWIELVHEELHPLSIEHLQVTGDRVRVEVKNSRPAALVFTAAGKSYTIDGNGVLTIEIPVEGNRPLEMVRLVLQAEKLPPVCRTIFVDRPAAAADWLVRQLPAFTLKVARDGSTARIERGGQVVGLIGPLVHCDGVLPKLQLVDSGDRLRFQGEGISLSIVTSGKEILIAIDSSRPCEGPVVRAPGSLHQGLLAGLEYLGPGEQSSSTLDIETSEHLRFAPDPLQLTMPLMALVTDRASLAMSWDDMSLHPSFATPNFFDGTADHRMALRGTRIAATLLVDQAPLEEMILWAVKRHGLPPLPKAPRSRDEQWALCLKALNGPLKTEAGWGHCGEPHWPRHPFADIASTVWRLTGQVPDLPKLVPGGAHVPNGSIYFVTGRAGQWLEQQRRQVQGIMRQQGADGSFHYDGKYRRGHFEDTALGTCAHPATTLLEFARVTGDAEAKAAGLRALDYMQRFDTPRGAQTWEVPLHTPDQLASAYAVWAYTRGYELTGEKRYLEAARRWALSGVPFVYLWSRYPVMLYGTPPVYGATNWVAPNWIGLPVQWVGGVYAYALTLLAPHEHTLDWKRLAEGILIAAEQMQFPDGPYVGLLPDSFALDTQQRRPWRINPCALVSLRMAVAGEVDFLSVADDGRHRVAAPVPVVLRDGLARLRGKPGLRYQVVVDGKRIVDVVSQGDDVIGL